MTDWKKGNSGLPEFPLNTIRIRKKNPQRPQGYVERNRTGDFCMNGAHRGCGITCWNSLQLKISAGQFLSAAFTPEAGSERHNSSDISGYRGFMAESRCA